VHNVVRDAKNDMIPASKGSAVRVVEETADSFLMVNADRSRVYEVLSNLLSNAIKFAEEGQIVVRAEKKEQDDGRQYAFVIVRDTGSGIHPDILPRLFTKFASKSEHGTGLGLFISKSIIEAHGGRMWGENNPDGRGATFCFTLQLSA
jgi:signal transduction histidine kinase